MLGAAGGGGAFERSMEKKNTMRACLEWTLKWDRTTPPPPLLGGYFILCLYTFLRFFLLFTFHSPSVDSTRRL